MKKLINLIALVMLVSTNVLTPFSYAEVENPEVIPENGVETVEECLGEVEEIPEINEETPELVSEEKGELEQENAENVAPENVLPNIQNDEETPVADEAEEEDTESDGVAQPVEETPEKEIQDEEENFEELESVEESVVMDVIPNTSVMLLPGQEFNSVIKTLANGGTYVAYTGVDNNIQSFERVDEIPQGVTTGEISVAGSEYPVYAWFSGGVLYYITKAGTIQLNEDSQNMFQNFWALTELDLSDFDTSDVTNVGQMFQGCSSLDNLNMNNRDLNNVTNRGDMFNGCSELENISIDNRNVSKGVGICGSMFSGLPKLKKMSVRNWKIPISFADWLGRTRGLRKLEEIDVSNWDLTETKDLGGLFADVENLKTIKGLDTWDTSGVQNMGQMFQGCTGLTGLDLSNFDTSKVTNMYMMFDRCDNLEVLNLSGWDFREYGSDSLSRNLLNAGYNNHPLKRLNLTNAKFSGGMNGAFEWLSLEEIKLDGVDTTNVTSMNSMFHSNRTNKIKNLDLSSFDTSQVTDMGGMFNGCEVENLNLSGWDFRKYDVSGLLYHLFPSGTNGSEMKLKNLNLTNAKFSGSMNQAFYSRGNSQTLEQIILSGVNTSGVTDMSSMFGDQKLLTSLDLSSFDTSNVANMSAMFNGCNSLTGLDLSSFDTSNVTNVSQMFGNCSSLTGLNLSNWDTSNVTNMGAIFYGCNNLEELNLSGWDFRKYSNASLMMNITAGGIPVLKKLNMSNTKYTGIAANAFGSLNNLEELNLDGADVSDVTNMSAMFNGDNNLKILNLSGLDTSNVENMSAMFNGCSSLTGLDLSNFDTSKVTNMSSIFGGCSKLEEINLSGWDFRKYSNASLMMNMTAGGIPALKKLNMANTKYTGNMSQAFFNLKQLEEINLNGVDTKGVSNMHQMFQNSEKLKKIDISGLNTTNVVNMGYMFYGCSSLTGLDLSSFDTSNLSDMNNLVGGCSKLEELSLSGWDFRKTDNGALLNKLGGSQLPLNKLNMTNTKYSGSMGNAFLDFGGLEINLDGVDTSEVTEMRAMFQGCSNLTGLDLSDFDTSNVDSMNSMFLGCNNLENLDLSNFDTSNVTDMRDMFIGCYKLENLNLDNWDFNKITNMGRMSSMFFNTSSLKKLSARNWVIPENFTNLITTAQLYGTGLSIDVSNWDLSNAKNLSSLFSNSTAREIKGLNTWNTSEIMDMNHMFHYCYNLTNIDVKDWDTSNVTNMYGMFEYCKMTQLDLGGWDTSNAENMDIMFKNCSNLEELNLSGWDFRKSTSRFMPTLFWGTQSLLKKLNMVNTKYSGDATYAFGGLDKLEELNLDGADTSNVTNMQAMFNGDSNLKILDLSSFDTSNVKDMNKMFYNTPNLKTIYASENFVTTALSGDNSSKDMFSGTTNVIGGNGTKFDPNYIDKTYALIDKVGQAGYFTDKNAINVKFINTLDSTETISTFKKGQKLTPPPVNGYHVVGGYLDEAMTQKIDLNKGVDSYSEIYVKYERNGSSGGGGGGGGGTTKPDTPKEEQKPADSSEQVPQNDNSASSGSNVKTPENDIQMDSQPSEQSSSEQLEGQGNGRSNTSDNSYTNEQKEAYAFAKENGITTMPTIQKADMSGKLTRIQMAKMLSQYAMNVLGQTPDTSKTIKFKDVTVKRDADYDNGVTLAYQLGIMGQNMPGNKFRPNDEVSRAEFVTALSRLLYSTPDGEYKSTSKYYIHHMEKLVKEGIITNDDPKMKERRGYVMIMLMRSAK